MQLIDKAGKEHWDCTRQTCEVANAILFFLFPDLSLYLPYLLAWNKVTGRFLLSKCEELQFFSWHLVAPNTLVNALDYSLSSSISVIWKFF